MSDITKPAKLDIRQTNGPSGAFADSNPAHALYDHEGTGSDPRPLKRSDEFHAEPLIPKNRPRQR